MAGRFDIALKKAAVKRPKKPKLRLKGDLDPDSLGRLISCIPHTTIEIDSASPRMPPWRKSFSIPVTIVTCQQQRSSRRDSRPLFAKVETTFDTDGSVLIRLPKKFAMIADRALQRAHFVLE